MKSRLNLYIPNSPDFPMICLRFMELFSVVSSITRHIKNKNFINKIPTAFVLPSAVMPDSNHTFSLQIQLNNSSLSALI